MTRDELARLPDDGNRYEVLDGKLLVSPRASLPHQFLACEIASHVRAYVKEYGLRFLVAAPCAVPEGKDELQPDIGVFPPIPPLCRKKWEDGPHPLLVIEVLSRSTQRRDHGIKRTAYMRRGIPEDGVPAFEMDLNELFAPLGPP